MKTNWDYTKLAQSYVNRPDYASDVIDQMLELAGINEHSLVCDIGAGTAHLTIPLLQRGLRVVAVEPNDSMRKLGKSRTEQWAKISWYEGTGEATGQPSNLFELVTFGSSFNVTDRAKALKESHRLLKNRGWFACMWNHRDLMDDLQQSVEKIIFSYIPDYSYGSRREDQTDIIEKSNLFQKPIFMEGLVTHQVPKSAWVEAWASHATLKRQAGVLFSDIISDIEVFVRENIQGDMILIPYKTKIWLAQKKQ